MKVLVKGSMPPKGEGGENLQVACLAARDGQASRPAIPELGATVKQGLIRGIDGPCFVFIYNHIGEANGAKVKLLGGSDGKAWSGLLVVLTIMLVRIIVRHVGT